jgi:hypothetical protein
MPVIPAVQEAQIGIMSMLAWVSPQDPIQKTMKTKRTGSMAQVVDTCLASAKRKKIFQYLLSTIISSEKSTECLIVIPLKVMCYFHSLPILGS